MKLEFNPAPFAGLGWKWNCTDADNYDGADDTSPMFSVVGYGETKRDAAQDWLDQTLELGCYEWQEEQAVRSEYVAELKRLLE